MRRGHSTAPRRAEGLEASKSVLDAQNPGSRNCKTVARTRKFPNHAGRSGI